MTTCTFAENQCRIRNRPSRMRLPGPGCPDRRAGDHATASQVSWALARREHMSDIIQAIAGLLSHQRTADLASARQT